MNIELKRLYTVTAKLYETENSKEDFTHEEALFAADCLQEAVGLAEEYFENFESNYELYELISVEERGSVVFGGTHALQTHTRKG